MNLKTLLKNLKLNESTISMILGAIVIVVVGVLVVNYFRGLDSGSTIPAVETENLVGNALPATHTVVSGDDLWSISEKYYGTGYNWTDIAEANNLSNPGNIEEGQELTIPDVEAKIAGSEIEDTTEVTGQPTVPTAEPTPEQSESAELAQEPTMTPVPDKDLAESIEKDNEISDSTYTVQKGDNLWNIAVRAYGDGFRWVEIAEANDLVNPDLIHSGNVFTLPR